MLRILQFWRGAARPQVAPTPEQRAAVERNMAELCAEQRLKFLQLLKETKVWRLCLFLLFHANLLCFPYCGSCGGCACAGSPTVAGQLLVVHCPVKYENIHGSSIDSVVAFSWLPWVASPSIRMQRAGWLDRALSH
jgi:hypothetical protein